MALRSRATSLSGLWEPRENWSRRLSTSAALFRGPVGGREMGAGAEAGAAAADGSPGADGSSWISSRSIETGRCPRLAAEGTACWTSAGGVSRRAVGPSDSGNGGGGFVGAFESGGGGFVEGWAGSPTLARPTRMVTRLTSRASLASARRPAARFTGMSAASSSSDRARRFPEERRLAAAVSEGVLAPLASRSRAKMARIEASGSPAPPPRPRGLTSATVPSSAI
jgi:hypothetical protein